jgi:hypothetical protein
MFVLDRIEESWAVIESEEETFTIPKSLLPIGVKEGDILTIHIVVDEEATRKTKESIEEKAKRLWK